MSDFKTCEYCGLSVAETDPVCPHCGAVNRAYHEAAASPQERVIERPKTIEEMKAYCAEKGMPLERMRFFVGQDYREPKAFGIYRDGRRFIVYKNKADGSRAVRYNGPDEDYAVNELFQKLLDECHKRGIYPDGLPDNPANRMGGAGQPVQKKRRSSAGTRVVITTFALIFAVAALSLFVKGRSHRFDGYYRYDNGVYYRYGDSWYYSDGDSDWSGVDSFPDDDYSDYYMGKDYDSDWDVEDFKDSDIWDDISSSDSDSDYDSSYDDWDSDDTDWDSDW